jgi:hypothetical protein
VNKKMRRQCARSFESLATLLALENFLDIMHSSEY